MLCQSLLCHCHILGIYFTTRSCSSKSLCHCQGSARSRKRIKHLITGQCGQPDTILYQLFWEWCWVSIVLRRWYCPHIRTIVCAHLLFVNLWFVFAQPVDSFCGVEQVAFIHGHCAFAMPNYFLIELGLCFAQPGHGMITSASPVSDLVLIEY